MASAQVQVLAIDASYAAIGWALACPQPVAIRDSGTIKFDRKTAEKKLPEIMSHVRGLLGIVEATLIGHGDGLNLVVAIENAWLGRNVQVLSKLSELRGAIIEAALSRDLLIERVDPRSWQISTGIPMRAKREVVKKSSIAMAKLRTGLPQVTEDQADAINIAWHMAGVLRMRGRTEVEVLER